MSKVKTRLQDAEGTDRLTLSDVVHNAANGPRDTPRMSRDSVVYEQ